MAEAVKSIIWKREEQTLNGKKVYKYLIGMVLLTDELIEGVEPIDTIGMGQSDSNTITKGLSALTKYEPLYPLGELSDAVMSVAEWTPDQLKKKKKPSTRKGKE